MNEKTDQTPSEQLDQGEKTIKIMQNVPQDPNNIPNSDQGTKSLSQRKKSALLLIVIVIVAFSGLLIAFGDQIWGEQKETYMIEMRDGIKLATDVYLPEGDGPFPIVLFRTPYGKEEIKNIGLLNYRQFGIGIVSQDHRGCHGSEGIYTAFASDGMDANDTIEWMNTQSWFNGDVGTFGGSARGITQYFQIPYVDSLKCQAIQVATPYLFEQAMFQGGAPRKMLAQNWLEGIDQGWYYADMMFENISVNSQFSQEHQIEIEDFSRVTWPSIHAGGWYDCFGQGILDGFSGYQYYGGIGGKGNAKLIMGPWTHNLFSRESGELTYPESAGTSTYYYEVFENMFAKELLGLDEYSYTDFPAVRYFVMGPTNEQSTRWNHWANAETWPVTNINQTYYLTSSGVLSISKPIQNSELSYVYNPHDPLETSGGANLVTQNRGPFDQRTVEIGRSDFITFNYTFSETTEYTGRVAAHLFVKSNCTDTDITVKLKDIYPDGREMLIQDGIVRMRFRENLEEEQLMDGSNNTIYEAWIDLWSSSYVFPTDHKMQIVISSSNYPRFDINPNTGAAIKPVTETTPMNIAQNTILIGGEYASSLILPIFDSSSNFI